MPYETPEPFTVDIPEHALIDLDERLRRWRPTTAIADKGSWASGGAHCGDLTSLA